MDLNLFDFNLSGVIESMRNKKNIWDRIKLLNKCIEKDKLKLSKKTSINLKKCIDTSVSSSIVGLLDGIISKQDVNLEEKQTDVLLLASGPMYITDKSSFDTEYTIVIPIPKKNALEEFNYLNEGTIGDLLTTSTLGPTYKRIKNNWANCNDPDSPLTSVLYIPHIPIILDPYTGALKKYYRKVNLLIVGVPKKKTIEMSTEEIVKDEDYSARIMADMLDAAIKCGCKNLIINPFTYKLGLDPVSSADLWNKIITSRKVNDHIDTVTFSVIKDNEFIIMGNHMFNTKK